MITILIFIEVISHDERFRQYKIKNFIAFKYIIRRKQIFNVKISQKSLNLKQLLFAVTLVPFDLFVSF